MSKNRLILDLTTKTLVGQPEIRGGVMELVAVATVFKTLTVLKTKTCCTCNRFTSNRISTSRCSLLLRDDDVEEPLHCLLELKRLSQVDQFLPINMWHRVTFDRTA